MARNWKASLRTAAGRHSSRRGAFSAGLTALVIAAVIVFNLLVAQLPESISKLDMSDNKIYTVCLLYTSPSPRDRQKSRMPSSA